VLLLLARRLGARRGAICSLGLSLYLMVATDAESQIIINGTALIFDSPDHNAVLPTGDPAVTHYVLEVWLPTSVASGTPLKTLDLGKPVPSPGSTTITVNQAQFLLGLPAGQDYVATVRVVGPAGESRSGPSNSFIRLYGPTPTSTPIVTGSANEVVLYAADVQNADIHGRWQPITTTGVAGGIILYNANLGEAKLTTALASPVNYVELRFDAAAGVPYHLWMRMAAASNYYANDSVYVQFSDSIDAGNNPVYRLGTTGGAAVTLEEGSGAGISGWGWNDQAYGAVADPIYFATNGPHVIRIQQREDGVAFDQIVLSAGTYLTKSPGALKNDTKIVPK
jgi:hypothetical protein